MTYNINDVSKFDEIVGEIPDKSIMLAYGKEFCVMCGRPTKNDSTVNELRTLFIQDRKELLEEVEKIIHQYSFQDYGGDYIIHQELLFSKLKNLKQ